MNHLVVIPRVIPNPSYWYQFPLGVAYISASLKKSGFATYTLNLNNREGKVGDVIRKVIDEHEIDIVYAGGLTGQYGAIREVLESVKQYRPSIITVAGGGIISSAPEYAMEALEKADYGVIGEGEIIVCNLCRAIEDGLDPINCAGLVLQRNGKWFVTPGEPEPVVLEDLPYPDYDGFEFDALLRSAPNTIGMSEYNTLSIITGRSCPFKCTFCFHPSGQKYRQRNLDDVFREIDYLVEKYNVKYLSISDELFFYGRNTDRLEDFCRRIKPYGIRWLAQFRVSDVTHDLVEMLKDANCATMAFGIESADNSVLASMQKKITVEQIERALEIVYSAGMAIQGVLIFGDIAETMETAKRTLDWWKAHAHYDLILSAVITYPGTYIFRYALENGLIKDPVRHIREGCPIIKLSKMTDEEYRWLFQQIALLPRQIQKIPESTEITRIDYPNSVIDISGHCVTCGQTNHWEGVRLFVAVTLTCRACGRKHIAPIPEEVAEHLRIGIAEIVARYGKVAFWGVNSYVIDLAGELQGNWDASIYYVDKSDTRIGLEIGGHRIQDPDVISKENIRCVVVMVVQYHTGLIQPIRDNYPQVEAIYSIADLLTNSFMTAPNKTAPAAE